MTRVRNFLHLIGAVAAISMVGCGGGESDPPTASVPDQTQPATQAVSPSGPKETIAYYLEAVRQGDAATVNQLLTAMAREKTTELNIAVAPPGSETAMFEVGSFRYVSETQDAAHVESRWSDLNKDGQRETYDITWILRSEQEGWRVAGMMGKFIENQPIMVFNFENPQEVIQKQQYAREQIERQIQDRLQAQNPASGTLQR